MLPILQIGPLALQMPGLFWIVGIWLGLTLAERYAPQRGVPANALYNLVFIVLAAGLAGARLGAILRYPSAFASNPLSVLSLNPGLLDMWAGAFTALVAALAYGQRKGLKLWPTLDALTPLLAALAIASGLAHIASGAAFGKLTQLPWGIELWGARRHPSQIYESLAAALILFVLWPGRKTWREASPGVYCLTFLALSTLERLLLEAYRGDSTLILGGMRQAQVIAWLVLAGCLIGLYRIVTSRGDARLRDEPKETT